MGLEVKLLPPLPFSSFASTLQVPQPSLSLPKLEANLAVASFACGNSFPRKLSQHYHTRHRTEGLNLQQHPLPALSPHVKVCKSPFLQQSPSVRSFPSHSSFGFYTSQNTSIFAGRTFTTMSGHQLSREEIDQLRQKKQTLRKQIRSRLKLAFPPTPNSIDENDNNLINQSNKVFSRLFSLPQYQSANSVGFFLSMPSGEIQTRDAVRKIVEEDGKVLYIPRVGLDFEKCDMDLIRVVVPATTKASKGSMFYSEWPRNKWGIPEPPVTEEVASSSSTTADVSSTSLVAQPGDIDLLIVPGLAFDSNGHRLGQGKGYYDRFIAKMRCEGPNTCDNNDDSTRIAKPLLVGVCLDEQFLDSVPYTEESDEGETIGTGGIPITHHDYIMDMVVTPSRIVEIAK